MTRRTSGATPLIALLGLALVGCGEKPDPPEDPPYAVPGMQVTQPTPGQPTPGPLAMGAPPTFDPPLAVPGQPSPIPPPPAPPMPPGQMPPGVQPGPVPTPAQLPTPPTAAAPLTLAPGFMPDPATARGMTAAQIPAGSLDPACTGFVPSQPAHVVTLSGAFSNLRVLVSSAADTVLVIRQPDGSFRCNDDTDPGVLVHPTIQSAFSPGPYTIWVGTYARETPPTPYVIGFTELATVTHATLGP